jgi:hypothetical protein
MDSFGLQRGMVRGRGEEKQRLGRQMDPLHLHEPRCSCCDVRADRAKTQTRLTNEERCRAFGTSAPILAKTGRGFGGH